MQINSNGLIVFHWYLQSSQLQNFPRADYPITPIISPLWTPFVPQDNGILFRRNTSDPLTLSWVRRLILLQNPDLDEYEPLVALVVTWHNFVLPNRDYVSLNISYIITVESLHSNPLNEATGNVPSYMYDVNEVTPLVRTLQFPLPLSDHPLVNLPPYTPHFQPETLIGPTVSPPHQATGNQSHDRKDIYSTCIWSHFGKVSELCCFCSCVHFVHCLTPV